MRLVVMLLVAGGAASHLVACYQPALRDCTVRCTGPEECATGQHSRDDGWCVQSSLANCGDSVGVTHDAAVVGMDMLGLDAFG